VRAAPGGLERDRAPLRSSTAPQGLDYRFSFADVSGYRLDLLQSLRLTDYDYERITAGNPRQLFGTVFSGRT